MLPLLPHLKSKTASWNSSNPDHILGPIIIIKISNKNFIYIPEDQSDSADFLEEFEEATRNSVSANEKEFLSLLTGYVTGTL